MGLGQSYLYIFLESKDGKYGESIDANTGYEVTSTKGAYPGCDGFEVVTHDIKYKPEDGMSFDIYIYNSRRIASKASYIFAYCSPRVKSHVVKHVKAYYSVLAPHNPLVITFHRETDDFNCDIDKLRKAGWDWASGISKYGGGEINQLLKDQYKKLAWEKSIEFDEGDKPTNNLIVFLREIGDDNYRVVFIPNKCKDNNKKCNDETVLNIKCLFTDNSKLGNGTEHLVSQVGCQSPNGAKNHIDAYFLDKVREKKFFHGIIVYYARQKPKQHKIDEKHPDDMALLVEFINSCSTISLKRKDKDGCLWQEGKVTYADLKSRNEELKKIKDEAEKYNLNTVILEKDSTYTCGSKVKTDTKPTYYKYTHEFTEAKNPNVLFKNKSEKIGQLDAKSIETKKVEVYYLKDVKKDDKPFLIAFYKNEDPKPTKVYHFNNKDKEKFEEWKELDVGKFEDRFKRIDSQTACTGDLYYLKKLVHKILTTEEDKPVPEAPPKELPPRPPVVPETPPPPPGLDWWLIIGCSVGAFFLIVALAIGYAIYWYNTTIGLLT